MSLIRPETNCPDVYATQYTEGTMVMGANQDGSVAKEMNGDDGGVVKVYAYGYEFVFDGANKELQKELTKVLLDHGWAAEAINKLLMDGFGVGVE